MSTEQKLEDKVNTPILNDRQESVSSSRDWSNQQKVVYGLKTFGAICLSILLIPVVLLLVEFVFGCAHVGEDTVVQPDALLGYAHLKNQNVVFRQEGYSHSHINSIGLRDREYSPTKPPGVRRIAVLGDSVTLGFEVPPEKTFPKLLEKKLSERSDGKFEVINCGMSGYGTGQEYLGYLDKVRSLQPDYVVLAYHLGDSDDNVAGGTNPPRPVFSAKPDGRMNVDFGDVDAWLLKEDAKFYANFETLRRNSRIFAILNKANLDLSADSSYKLLSKVFSKPLGAIWQKFLQSLPAAGWSRDEARQCYSSLPPLPAADLASPAPSSSMPQAAVANPLTPNYSVENGQSDVGLFKGYMAATDQRCTVAKSILNELNQRCAANGSKLVIVGLPAFSNSFFYYRELQDIERFCAKNQIQFIDTSKDYPAREPMQDSDYFFGLHFNCAGHKLMADLLASKLNL